MKELRDVEAVEERGEKKRQSYQGEGRRRVWAELEFRSVNNCTVETGSIFLIAMP